MPHADVRVVEEVVGPCAGVAVKGVQPPAPGGAVCLGYGDAGVAVVPAVDVGVVGGDAHDVAVVLFVVRAVGVKHDHAAAGAAVRPPERGVQGRPHQAVAVLVKYLEAGVYAHDDVVAPHDDVGVGRHALLRLGVVDGFEAGPGGQGALYRFAAVHLNGFVHALLQRLGYQGLEGGFAHRPFVHLDVGLAAAVLLQQWVAGRRAAGHVHHLHFGRGHRLTVHEDHVVAQVHARCGAAPVPAGGQGQLHRRLARLRLGHQTNLTPNQPDAANKQNKDQGNLAHF